jgi:hypothetical protein
MQRDPGSALGISDTRTVAPRRSIALLLSAALIHLSAARADAACAQHGERSGPAPRAHAEAAAHGEHHANSAAATPDEETCDTPMLPECCQALATCSMTLGEGSLSLVQSHPLHTSVIAALDKAPVSVVASPDPPPPRL